MSNTKKEKPRHLGRGLESLLGPISQLEQENEMIAFKRPATDNYPVDDAEKGDFLREVPINSVSPNPYQARTVWDEQELNELCDSIKANGIVQPIVVRPAGTGYQLVAGERRLRAAKLALLETVPAFIRRATDEQLHEWSLVENIHRVDLNPLERANAYREYIDVFSLTQTEAAERLGEDRSVISNYLRLLDLPQEIKQMLSDKKLSMGHARAILALPNDQLRRNLAKRAMAGRLSVREVERLVRKHLVAAGHEPKPVKTKSPHIQDLENQLTRHFGTKVNIETKKGGQRGKIVIEFYSLDEFDGIAEKLGISMLEDA